MSQVNEQRYDSSLTSYYLGPELAAFQKEKKQRKIFLLAALHDLGNPLGIIKSSIELAPEGEGLSSEEKKVLSALSPYSQALEAIFESARGDEKAEINLLPAMLTDETDLEAKEKMIAFLSQKAGETAGKLFSLNEGSSLKDKSLERVIRKRREESAAQEAKVRLEEVSAESTALDLLIGEIEHYSQKIKEELEKQESYVSLSPEYGKRVLRASRRLQFLARQSRDFFHLDKLKPLSERVVSGEVINQACLDLEGYLEGFSLEKEIEEDCFLWADREWVRRIINNLLHNAVKYSQSGSEKKIIVSARKQDGQARISVADSGIGITKQDLENLRKFSPQFRTEKGRQTAKGSGLGLYLCQNLALKMGGWLEVDSTGEGQGSVFTLVLPLAEGKSERIEKIFSQAQSWHHHFDEIKWQGKPSYHNEKHLISTRRALELLFSYFLRQENDFLAIWQEWQLWNQDHSPLTFSQLKEAFFLAFALHDLGNIASGYTQGGLQYLEKYQGQGAEQRSQKIAEAVIEESELYSAKEKEALLPLVKHLIGQTDLSQEIGLFGSLVRLVDIVADKVLNDNSQRERGLLEEWQKEDPQRKASRDGFFNFVYNNFIALLPEEEKRAAFLRILGKEESCLSRIDLSNEELSVAQLLAEIVSSS